MLSQFWEKRSKLRKKGMEMKKGKRVLAMIGVVILAGLYVATLISAILATPATDDFFKASLLATIIVPLLIYVYMLIYRLIFGKNKDIEM